MHNWPAVNGSAYLPWPSVVATKQTPQLVTAKKLRNCVWALIKWMLALTSFPSARDEK